MINYPNIADHSKKDGQKLSVQSSMGKNQSKSSSQKSSNVRIFYRFFYNNNSRLQTEARFDLNCPWCALNCMKLYSLLKHLTLSHPRFLFSYQPLQDGAKIDVSINELFDTSYEGNPYDLVSQPTINSFSSEAPPAQRNSITTILVWKPKRHVQNLNEFVETNENDLSCGPYFEKIGSQKPLVSGHNRVYHNSNTNLAQPAFTLNQPAAEDRIDPPWLSTHICQMIDQFRQEVLREGSRIDTLYCENQNNQKREP